VVAGFESVSTWRQPLPAPASATRSVLIETVAGQVAELSAGRLRVAVDGLTGAGKTCFAHELAAALRVLGRPTMRASMDDFKHPWRHATEHGYDRISGQGYYRNAHDFASARDLLLHPAGPGGSGKVALCGHDPLTGQDHRDETIDAPMNAILVVDSVFAFRPEYNDCWEYRIWLEVASGVALRRGISRDAAAEGIDEAIRLHQDRYRVAERIYLAEVDPCALASIIIGNTDFKNPCIMSSRGR
jgi:uridine kinase